MHDIRRLGLQVFAAPNNLTGEVQIEVKPERLTLSHPLVEPEGTVRYSGNYQNDQEGKQFGIKDQNGKR